MMIYWNEIKYWLSFTNNNNNNTVEDDSSTTDSTSRQLLVSFLVWYYRLVDIPAYR